MKVKNVLVEELKKDEHVMQVLSWDQVKAKLDEKRVDYKAWSKTIAGYIAPAQDTWFVGKGHPYYILNKNVHFWAIQIEKEESDILEFVDNRGENLILDM